MPYTNRRKSIACLFFVLFLACSQNEAPNFSLQPAWGWPHEFTVAITETTSRENGPEDSVKYVYDFTLTPQRPGDSSQTFIFTVRNVSVTRPAVRLITGEHGGIAVMPTGNSSTLSTASDPGDSATQLEKQWYGLMRSIVGDSLKVTMNKKGEVNGVSGYDLIRVRIMKATGKDMRDIGPTIRPYVGIEAVTDLINQVFFYLPAIPIKPGAQWVKNVTLIDKAPVKYSHLVKVDEINKDTVRLGIQSIVSSRLGEGKLIVEGEMTGTVQANISSGLPDIIQLTENSVTHTDSYDVKKKRTIHVMVFHSPANM